jgi:hypothetical protein
VHVCVCVCVCVSVCLCVCHRGLQPQEDHSLDRSCIREASRKNLNLKGQEKLFSVSAKVPEVKLVIEFFLCSCLKHIFMAPRVTSKW